MREEREAAFERPNLIACDVPNCMQKLQFCGASNCLEVSIRGTIGGRNACLKTTQIIKLVRWGTLKVWDNPKQTEGDGGELLGCPTS